MPSAAIGALPPLKRRLHRLKLLVNLFLVLLLLLHLGRLLGTLLRCVVTDFRSVL